MKIKLGYGKSFMEAELRDESLMGILAPEPMEDTGIRGEREVQRSLANPIGAERLCRLAMGHTNIVIVVSDITRPVPSCRILPSIFDELMAAGVEEECITVVFAVGSHRKHTPEEMKKLVGELVYRHIRCIDADVAHCVRMGVTSRGTPVDIFEAVANADFRICVGNIEYHYFAGYSGGVKAIMPGVSTREAIQSNHSLMVLDGARAGVLEDNPVRCDIEEAGCLCPVDFIVNVVLDEKKEIVRCVSGDPVIAHRAGCAYLDTLYKKEIPAKADIVLVSAGGYPKDINMYQAQKALDNAGHAVREGGIIIWAASCAEGFGERNFEEWMTGHENSGDMIAHIRRDFVLGGHKAAAIAMVLSRADIMLVSDLPDELVSGAFLQPQPSVEKALAAAFDRLGSDARVLVMPYGGSTLPVLA